MLKRVHTFGLCAVLALTVLSDAFAQGTKFTFQGYLRQNNNPVNTTLSMTFTLFNHPTNTGAGAQVGSPITIPTVSVQNGLFTVELDFGNVWDGSSRWLQIQINTTPPVVLSPRIPINPAPYAIRAAVANPIGAAGGDLSGTYPNPTVARLQGRAVHNAAPADGQVLKWSAANNRWEPAPDWADTFWRRSWTSDDIYFNEGGVGIGVTTPFFSRLHVETSGIATAVFGNQTSTTGYVHGVHGQTASNAGIGVLGVAEASTGNTRGVYGVSRSTSGTGVFGYATSATGATVGVRGEVESNAFDSAGVLGQATAGWGVHGRSTTGTGVYGLGTATSGLSFGVYGESRSPDGTGVYGIHTNSAGTRPGVHGVTNSTADNAVGVLGEVASTSPGAYSAAVRGINRGTGGLGIGVWGSQDGSGWGVYGTSVSGIGVYGLATATTGENYGVRGQSASSVGTGVYGLVTANTGSAWGVWGETRSRASTAYGVVGSEPFASGDGPDRGPGHAVYGFGSIAATGTKSFQIDHPLRPETHYLNHFCAEGPEPYNIYSGVVVLDARGEAWVQLPDYFEAINRDPRYTLTPIGAPMPNLHIAVKIQNNRFKIAGGVPSMEVSWEVKAIRNDLWIQRYGYETEQEKEDEIKGRYLHPELYGQPLERGILYRPESAAQPNPSGKR